MFINSIIDYRIMRIFIICSLLFGLILFINKDNKKSKYLILVINIIIISIIIYYYNCIFKSNIFIHFMHSIYFYFLNSIIYLILITICFFKNIPYKRSIISFYIISLIFIMFSIFMTYYVKNIHIIVIGNIYPMIVFGNYLYMLFYGLLIIYIIKK